MVKNGKPAIEDYKPIRKDTLEYFQASIGDEEIKSLVETIQSGWLTYGPKSREFEDKFAEYISSHGKPQY